MRHIIVLVVTVILYAMVTAFLYMVGLKKKATEKERLTKTLFYNCSFRITRYLSEHPSITEDGIAFLIKDVKAKEFFSGKTAKVADSSEFQAHIIDYMLRNNQIQKELINGTTHYSLSEKEKQNG